MAIKQVAPSEPDKIVPNSVTPNTTPSGYGPSSLQSAYALPSTSSGSGQTVAIVDAYDDPSAESDLATYRSQYGLPPCTTANGCFKKVNQNGSTTSLPQADAGWAGEISLDVDMVSAICPNCHILLVEATSPTTQNLGTAVNTAVNLGAKYVSNSYGGAENGSENSYDSSYFNHPGVAITASSGDSDYDGGSYPATSKYVTAVGGTSLRTASNSRGWSETVWNTTSYTEGTGSGCSRSVPKPAFQNNVSTGCARRAEADVSAVADPATGVAVYQTYGGSGWAVYGGTSAAAPIVAGVYALAGAPGSSDVPNAYPYAHAGNLNDVTSGTNGTCGAPICTAGAGWDGPTGLGTPNGVAAFTAGGGNPGSVTVANPGSKTGTVGTAVSLQLSASGGTSPYTWTATGLPTGLSISSSGLISGTPTAAGSYSVTATAKDAASKTGSTTFSWTISTTSGGGCSGQKLTNPGFESGTTGWTSTSGVINTNGAHSHAGTGYAWLDGYGSTHTDTLSQSVSIPAGCHASLSYYLYISSGESTSTAYDKLTVTANGATVQSYSNVNKGTGYVQRTVDLSSYAGSTVAIKWTGTEDSSIATSFFIDDTALTLS
jgi:subtilase family serine protease